MKKLSKILLIVLSLALVLGVFAVAAFADNEPFYVDNLARATWEDAIANADEDTPVNLAADYTASSKLTITKSVTVNLNGYTITASADVFDISGSDVTVKVVGPGTIVTGGKAFNVAGGATLDISGGLTVESTATSAVTLASVEGTVKVAGDLTILTSANQQGAVKAFDIAANSRFVANGANIVMQPDKLNAAAVADSYGNVLVEAGAGSLVDVADSKIELVHGKILSAKSNTTEIAKATMLFNRTDLKAWSNFGTGSQGVIYLADAYTEITFNNCNVVAGGRAIGGNIIDMTKTNKVFVNWNNTSYAIPADAKYGSPRLFCDGVSAIVNGGILYNTHNGTALGNITVRTKLWNGSEGVLIKEGTKFTSIPLSDVSIPVVDGENTYYYDPAKQYNANFSLEVIDEVSCVFVSETKVNKYHEIESFYTTSLPRASIEIKADFTKNFNNGVVGTTETPAPIAKGWGARYGEGTIHENEAGTNRYFAWMYDASKFTEYEGYNAEAQAYPKNSNSYVGIDLGPISANHPNALYKYDYVTIDFDLSSDVVNPYGLASYGYSGVNLIQRDGSAMRYSHSNTICISDNANSNSAAKFKVGSLGGDLSTVPGEWNHITVVIEVDNSYETDESGTITKYNLSKSQLHLYVNGAYAGSTSILDSASDDPAKVKGIGLDELRFGTSLPSASSKSYGLCLDNIALSYYTEGYVGNIQKLVADKTMNILSCDDMIYNTDYQFDLPNTHVATVDGVKYFNELGVIKNIQDGSLVVLNQNLTTPIPEKAFTIDTNGYTFVNTSEDYYTYQEDASTNIWYVKLANQKAVIFWDIDDEYGLFLETEGTLNSTPAYPTDVEDILDLANKKMYVFLGWSYEDYGVEEPDQLLPLTQRDLNDGEVVLYPVFRETDIAYSIKNELSGEINYYPPVTDGSVFSAQLATATSAANSVVTVVLYEDVVVSKWATVSMKGTLNFDLNGNAFCFATYGGTGERKTLFGGTDDTWFNLYSSKENGRLFNYTYYTNGGKVSSSAVLGGGNANFGTYKNEAYGIDANGQNLFVDSVNLVDHYGQVISDKNIDTEFTYTIINIDGGTYRRGYTDSMGLIIARKFMKVSIKNASINVEGSPIFATDPRYTAKLVVDVDNSYVYSAGNMFGHFLANSTVTFTNSVVHAALAAGVGSYDYANLTDDAGRNASCLLGTVVLGKGTSVASGRTMDLANIKIADGCIKVGTSTPVDCTYTANTITFVKQGDAYVLDPSTLETRVATRNTPMLYRVFEEGGSGYATIKWIGYNDELIEEQYSLVGTNAIYDTSSIPNVMLNNGWYDLKFDKWDSEDMSITEAKTYEFRAVYKPVANFKLAKTNMTLMTYYQFNVYAPLDNLPEGVSNVSWGGDANGTPMPAYRVQETLINGDRYLMTFAWPGAYSGKNVGQMIMFEVDGVRCMQWIAFKIDRYLEAVLTREEATEAEKALAMECMRYNLACINYYEFLGVGTSSLEDETKKRYERYLADENYNKYLNDLDTLSDNFTEAELNVDYSGLSTHLSGTSMVFAHKSGFAFVPQASLGLTPDASPGNGAITVRVAVKDAVSGVSANNYPSVATVNGASALVLTEFRMYNLRQPMTVNVYTDSWSVVASGSYSLAAYIAGIEAEIAKGDLDADTLADYEKGLELAKMMYSFSMAAENYLRSK